MALPISRITAGATVILPLITGIIISGTQLTASPAKSPGKHVFGLWPRLPIILVLLLIIYDTVIATLALTQMAPPSSLHCGLANRWSRLFSDKNSDIIRRIQDRYDCCGFNSVLDRAWPFPGGERTARACVEAFGRERSCFGRWRQDEQITGGLLLLVAVVNFLFKVSKVLYLDLLNRRS